MKELQQVGHNEKPSTGLSEQLEKFKMKLGRLKNWNATAIRWIDN